MKRAFEIEFPDDSGPLWMNRDNLLLCLGAYCRNTVFTVRDVTGDQCDPSPASNGLAANHTFRYDQTTGALLSDTPIVGLTQEIDPSKGYDAPHFICETLSRSAAEKIAAALGGTLQ